MIEKRDRLKQYKFSASEVKRNNALAKRYEVSVASIIRQLLREEYEKEFGPIHKQNQ